MRATSLLIYCSRTKNDCINLFEQILQPNHTFTYSIVDQKKCVLQTRGEIRLCLSLAGGVDLCLSMFIPGYLCTHKSPLAFPSSLPEFICLPDAGNVINWTATGHISVSAVRFVAETLVTFFYLIFQYFSF